MMSEIWKDIPYFRGSYQVSSMGRVRSVDRVIACKDGSMRKHKGRVLKLHVNKNTGYECLSLCNDGRCNTKTVHRLVLETFKPHVNMNVLDVNHIDGNKLNNHLTNLEWLTRRDNMLHACDTGLVRIEGERNPQVKLSNADVLEILQRLDTGETHKDIGLDYGVSRNCITDINKGLTWRSVREEYERTKKTIPR